MNQVVEKALRGMALLKVANIRHWTDRTFSFSCERPQGFRFRSGEFVMIGLMVEGKPLVRAYSIASPSWDDALEFYSIKVQDGPLTSRLQHLGAGRRDRHAAEVGRARWCTTRWCRASGCSCSRPEPASRPSPRSSATRRATTGSSR